jgi:murein DD-endopeptidase MepM/ murein hydrolase activator NlpD
VAFAGQVGGRRYVTLQHADGLRTTYGPLARMAPAIEPGATVDRGTVVGAAGEHLLWTARLGGAYLDPAALLTASGTRRVRLVPDRVTTLVRRPGARPVAPEHLSPDHPRSRPARQVRG